MAPISRFSPQNVLCCPGKNPSPSQQQGGGVWGRTELLPQALHLRLQALAVGCCLPLQLLVLPAHFWEPGRGERDDRRDGRELPKLGTRPWWPGGRLSSCGGTAQPLRRAWESENEPGVLHVAKTANLWLRFSPLLTAALARALEEAARPGASAARGGSPCALPALGRRGAEQNGPKGELG